MELLELLKTRRTYRRFDQEREIPSDVVEDILQSLQYSSCGNNRQPLRYVVVQKKELVEQVFSITKWAAALPPELGQPKADEHPTMFIAVLVDSSLKNVVTAMDAGLAISNMTLAAWNKGVGSCILYNVNREKLTELLTIPENLEVNCVVAFGYPTHESHIIEVEEGAPLAYSIDEHGDYVVPRHKINNVVRRM